MAEPYLYDLRVKAQHSALTFHPIADCEVYVDAAPLEYRQVHPTHVWRTPAARRIARTGYSGLQGMARSASGPDHQLRDARDGTDGEARQSAEDFISRRHRPHEGALRQSRP